MDLIYIYGPPASGKLTVAKELAKITGYKIFHNHHTVDMLLDVFEFGTDTFFRLSHKFRLELIEAAAKEKVPGLIFTFVYAYPEDNAFVRKVVRRVEKHKGKVKFVRLSCDDDELHRRVVHPGRKKHRKLKHVNHLKATMKRWDLMTKIPFVRTYEVDNTRLYPKTTARKIKEHYRLRKVK